MPQPSMSEVGEAGEVVATEVNLLHERGGGEDTATWLQDPDDLGRATRRVDDMLQYGDSDDPIQRLVLERQIMTIGDQVRGCAQVYV
jgi:hypothetical protein